MILHKLGRGGVGFLGRRLVQKQAWFKMLSFWVTGADGERSCPAEADGWMVNPTGCASVAFEALVAE